MSILVTGAAGFIGFHVADRLLARGDDVIGLDNCNEYYSVELKRARVAELQRRHGDAFRFVHADFAEEGQLRGGLDRLDYGGIVHLGAQAGVRYSLRDPHAYVDANIQGFVNILEGCRHNGCRHLLFASSSSVYGANTKLPFRTSDNVDHPISLYAASKKANELMAHSYAHLFRLPATGLRFFTVYGPWGRPDMAMWIFTRAVLEGKPIPLFNHGKMRRDFTYVDDVVEPVVRLIEKPAAPDPSWSGERPDPSRSAAPWRIYNIGNNQPTDVPQVVSLIEKVLGRTAQREMLPMQPGDVPETYADVDDLMRDVGFRPATPIAEGIARFIAWYREYHGQ
jgi:UDP-glucuronate 4-epimerase